jgi:primosomal protein N' (replication factor Y)
MAVKLAHSGDRAEPASESERDEIERYEIMGPVPAPIYRVARRYRWHILLKLAPTARPPDLSGWQRLQPKGVSLTVDVDPLNLS